MADPFHFCGLQFNLIVDLAVILSPHPHLYRTYAQAPHSRGPRACPYKVGVGKEYVVPEYVCSLFYAGLYEPAWREHHILVQHTMFSYFMDLVAALGLRPDCGYNP